LKVSNNKLESLEDELKAARSLAQELQNTQREEFAAKVKSLEATVSGLQDELQIAKSKAAEAAQIFEEEKEALHTGILLSSNSKESLEEELSTARSMVQKLQATMSDAQISTEELQIQIANLQKDRGMSNEVCKGLEAELLKATSELTDSSARTQSELSTWQAQVKVLEASLEKANSDKDTSEEKARELASELSSLKVSLEQRSKIANYGFPAATASGALAAVGLMAFLKNFRRP
jgi:chromosome segregation ATPase